MKKYLLFDSRWTFSYLLVQVGQPVHALQLVPLEFAVEDGGLGNVFTRVDGRIGEAVALPEAGARGGAAGRVQRGAAAVLGLLVEHPRLRREVQEIRSVYRHSGERGCNIDVCVHLLALDESGRLP